MAKPLAVLIVEDSESDAQIVVRLLEKAGYKITFEQVETAAQMHAALQKQDWEVVISDYSMPQFDGPAALALLQEMGIDIPFITVSGTVGEETAVGMLKAGAHDYLLKGNLMRLAPAVERELAQAEVRRERKQAELALARQSEELRQRNDELSRLYRASGTLISKTGLTLQELAETILATVQEEFGQVNCSLFVVRKDSNELVRLVATGSYTEHVKNKNIALDGPGLVAQALRTGKTVNVPDVRLAPNYVQNWELAQSELSIPLKVGDNVIGVIDVQSPERNAFSPNDERLMTIFAERAALTLEHSRLNAQTESRLQHLTALSEIDRAIISSFDLQLSLATLLAHAIVQLGVDAADVLLFDSASQMLEYTAGQGFRTQVVENAPIQLSRGHAARAVLDRRLVHILDLKEQPDDSPRSALFVREDFVSYYAVPLLAKGELNGVLEIFQRAPHEGEAEWLDFLKALAGQAAIAIDNITMFDSLQRSNSELSLAYDATIEGWSRALDLRDKETEGHTLRVTEMTMKLAHAFRLSAEELIHVRWGSLLHDIGKMGVPDGILFKPGPLTEDERELMRKHPDFAYEMLSPISYLHSALDIPYCHHEKWDGTGYPRGLKGEQIPLTARIFAVVDVWDALRSDRPYRKAWSPKKVREHIQSLSGSHFEPGVVEEFLRMISTDKQR